MFRLIFLLSLLGFASVGTGASPLAIEFDNGVFHFGIGKHLEYYLHKGEKLDVPDIQEIHRKGKFKRQNKQAYNTGYERGQLWLSGTLNNLGAKEQMVFIGTEATTNRILTLYYKSSDQWFQQSRGVKVPMNLDPYRFRLPTFSFSVPPGKTRFFISLDSDLPRGSDFYLSDATSQFRLMSEMTVVVSALIGCFIMLLIFSLMLMGTRFSPAIVYYCFYILSMIMVMIVISGFLQVYFFPDISGNFVTHLRTFLVCCLFSLPCLFTRHFLDLDRKLPLASKILNITVGLQVINASLVYFWDPVIHSIIRVPLFFLIGAPTMVFSGIYCRSDASARFYLAGWSTFLVGAGLVILQIGNTIDLGKYALMTPVFASLVEAFFFLLGMANKVRLTRMADESKIQNLNRDLSRKVEVISSVASGLAHEVNNPLMLLQGNTGLLREHWQGSQTMLSRFDQMERALARITKTIGDIRIFAGEAERVKFMPLRVDTIVKEAIRSCPFNVDLESRISKEWKILGRKDHMVKAINNLLVNAGEAAKNSSKPWIRVTCHVVGQFIEIRIVDNGPGILDREGQKIFDPFYTNKEVGRGTGMGLATSKSVVESLGGSLQWLSIEPHTTFRLLIPLYFGEAIGSQKPEKVS